MNFTKAFFGLTACLFAASLTGCVVHSTPPPPPEGFGSITVDVTIDGLMDPADCDFFVVDTIEITLLDAAGPIDTFSTGCKNFGLQFTDLSEGFYDTQVLLRDFNGVRVSDIVIIQDAKVVANTDFHVTVDFPGSTIHP